MQPQTHGPICEAWGCSWLFDSPWIPEAPGADLLPGLFQICPGPDQEALGKTEVETWLLEHFRSEGSRERQVAALTSDGGTATQDLSSGLFMHIQKWLRASRRNPVICQ